MGGIRERLIQSVKETLKVILYGRYLKDELLLKLFAEVENIINTRPLTHVCLHPDYLETIKGNHFLLGSSRGINSSGIFEARNLRRAWKRSQILFIYRMAIQT